MLSVAPTLAAVEISMVDLIEAITIVYLAAVEEDSPGIKAKPAAVIDKTPMARDQCRTLSL